MSLGTQHTRLRERSLGFGITIISTGFTSGDGRKHGAIPILVGHIVTFLCLESAVGQAAFH